MDAELAFLSWVRRGIATKIQLAEAPLATTPRAIIPVTVTVNGQDATVELPLVGPAEVAGFDTRAIIRTWPAPDATDAEPNYFPLLEVDQPDLPWRYTPASPATGVDRSSPWLGLIVVKDDASELAGWSEPGGDRPFGIVTLAPNTPLPDLTQSFAWAHAQVSGAAADVGTLAEDQPERVIARFLCPRRLSPNVSYWVMLVPFLRQAVLAGLRSPVDPMSNALEKAWTGAAVPAPPPPGGFRLPVYYRWRFRTGVGGDFEALVGMLRPRALTTAVGARGLDISVAGGGLPADPTVLAMGGALQPIGASTPPTASPAVKTALRTILNAPDVARTTGSTPVVAPPLYGQWYPRLGQLTSGIPPWFQQLNENPDNRVAAGLGTQVIQSQQRQLMAAAWRQVGAIRAINDQMRKAQLAREVARRLHARWLAAAEDEQVIFLTAALHGHVKRQANVPASRTVQMLTRRSLHREALFSGAFRRLARPLGKIGRRLGKPDTSPPFLIKRINEGLRVAPPQPEAYIDAQGNRTLPTHVWLRALTDPQWPETTPQLSDIPESPPGTPRPTDCAWDPEYGPEPTRFEQGNGADSPSIAAFRAAARAMVGRDVTPAAAPTQARLSESDLATRLRTALHPNVTIPASLKDRLTLGAGLVWNPPDPIEPVMAAPHFQYPMYLPLAAMSQDWILPGVKEIPPNTVTLAEPNRVFIEAYMVGLNHEMARELLWNEYPTDQRGTYFQQFWDAAPHHPVPGYMSPDLRDIAELHSWTDELGDHEVRDTEPPVLIVRGEVLRRYPRTMIYAVRATLDGTTRILSPAPGDQRAPIFRGVLPSDLSFFGFDIPVSEAKGSPGWFFVFQEQPSEPRFGLDVTGTSLPSSWDELSWQHFNAPGYLDLTEGPDTSGLPVAHWYMSEGSRAADLAYITFQQAVRVAIHASEMLP